jgi:hypothetical protein
MIARRYLTDTSLAELAATSQTPNGQPGELQQVD